MFETFGLAEFILIYVGFMLFIVAYFLIGWLRGRGKIAVRVLRPIGPITFLKKPQLEGNIVYMTTPKKGKGIPWTIKFYQTYPIKAGPLGMSRRMCFDVYPGAPRAIIHNYEDQTETAPTYDRAAEEKLFEAGVIKYAGQTGQKL